jgi:hypothetical protein
MGRGQGAFEYLLIIGGSVLLASVMLVAVQGNFGAIAPEINMSVSSINKLTTGVDSITCSDCDAAFVNVGEYQSVSNYMLKPDSVDSSKVVDGSIQLIDVDTRQIQKRVADSCPAGTNAVQIYENGTLFCDAGSWVINGNNITNRNTGMVIVPTLNVTRNLYAPGIGAGSLNITFLNATNAYIDNLTVRNAYVTDTLTAKTAYVTDNANVGIGLTATQLTARSGISAPGFTVSSSVTNVNSLYAQQLCMRRSGPSSSYVCINYWTDLLNVLYAQVG